MFVKTPKIYDEELIYTYKCKSVVHQSILRL